jgi:hypothetical protein
VAPLVRIAPNQRTVLAAHVPLKLVDRCRLRPPHHIEGDRLMRVVTETPHFKVQVTDRYANRKRWDVFRRGVSTIIGKGVPSFQLNQINRLKGSP